MIYLDYNATSPLLPDVKEAMVATMGEPLNASSVHAAGRKARKLLEESRTEILKFVNADAMIFCGSGTEANNMALAQRSIVVVSAIEHDSVYNCRWSEEINVLPSGVVDVDDMEKKLSKIPYTNSRLLVSVMLANNETGVIQPIKQIAEIVHKFGGWLHVDAVQAFGKMPLDFKDLNADLMTISSHKVGGPTGVAALVHKPELEITPILYGGGQEHNRRAGTENICNIVGFAQASRHFQQNVSRETFLKLRNLLEAGIKKISNNAVIFGEEVERLPNTTCLAMPGVESATQLIHFDMAGICVSAGSACGSGKVEVSRVLKEMKAADAKYALRISLGWGTTEEHINAFVKSWGELYERTRKQVA